MIFRCELSLDDFNCVNELTNYLKKVTGTNITCSLSLKDIKSYIDIKRDQYIEQGEAHLYNWANSIGFQENETLVYKSEVNILKTSLI